MFDGTSAIEIRTARKPSSETTTLSTSRCPFVRDGTARCCHLLAACSSYGYTPQGPFSSAQMADLL